MSIQKFKNSFIIIIGIFVVILLCVGFINKNIWLTCPAYECLLFPGKNLWKIQAVYENTNSTWRGLLVHPNYLIRLEQISHILPEEAVKLSTIKFMQTRSLFDTARSPYPGVITDKIVCDEKYKPLLNRQLTSSGIMITYYSGFLNNRLQYGNCTEDQIAYKGYVALFYCPKIREWYNIEFIVPKRKITTDSFYIGLFKQIDC